ncbi:hypothetical protein [uncultured Friedmanniella sp.]|uniref:hypothetical protein n=1 Tax=uncultured Friedmanniella sp. TaxID=335381 RepID=UPI0035CA3A24
MNPLILRSLSGSALVLGAVGCLIGGVLHPVVDGEAHSIAAITAPGELLGSLTLLIGTVLLLLGLPGVYGWLAGRLGRLGLVGFVLYFLGNLLSAVPHLVVMALLGPVVARRAPELISHDDMIIDSPLFATEQMIFGLVLVAGLLILSIALVRCRALPRWIGVVGLVGSMIVLIPLPEQAVTTGLQVELARAVMIGGLGLIAVRSTRAGEKSPGAAHAELVVGVSH